MVSGVNSRFDTQFGFWDQTQQALLLNDILMNIQGEIVRFNNVLQVILLLWFFFVF